ncbi:MAG: matrixin family metalloprotease [Hyphomicrobiales bacterium]
MILRIAATLWCALLFFALPSSADDFRLLVLDGSFVKWGEPALGTGAEVTYAFATTEVVSDEARNCKRIAPFAELSSSPSLAMSALKNEAHEAFRTWERVSNLRFQVVDDEDDAQIIIGVEAEPKGLAFTNVAPETLSTAARALEAVKTSLGLGSASAKSVKTIGRSLICLNPWLTWKIGLDGNNKTYDVRYTLTHEIGHAIGLDHPGASGALMGFRYNEKMNGLQAGDIQAVRTLYGP